MESRLQLGCSSAGKNWLDIDVVRDRWGSIFSNCLDLRPGWPAGDCGQRLQLEAVAAVPYRKVANPGKRPTDLC